MAELYARFGIDALAVQLGVDRVGSDLAGVELSPDRRETVVVLAAAERTWAVAGSEGSCFVEKEELGVAARLKERCAMPAAELEPAGNPAPAVVAATNAPVCVVQAASVAVHEAARRLSDELAERRDPVLPRH